MEECGNVMMPTNRECMAAIALFWCEWVPIIQ